MENQKSVYILYVQPHNTDESLRVFDNEEACKKAFFDIIMARYFDKDEDTKEDVEKAWDKGWWNSGTDDWVTADQQPVLSDWK